MKALNMVLTVLICSWGLSQIVVAEEAAKIKPQAPGKVAKPLSAEGQADRAAAL